MRLSLRERISLQDILVARRIARLALQPGRRGAAWFQVWRLLRQLRIIPRRPL